MHGRLLVAEVALTLGFAVTAVAQGMTTSAQSSADGKKLDLDVRVERQESNSADMVVTKNGKRYRLQFHASPGWRTYVVADTSGNILAVRLSTASSRHHWELEARSSMLDSLGNELLEPHTISTLPKPTQWAYAGGVVPFGPEMKRGKPLVLNGPLGQIDATTSGTQRTLNWVCDLLFDWSDNKECAAVSGCIACSRAMVSLCNCWGALSPDLNQDQREAACRNPLDQATAACLGYVDQQAPLLELSEKAKKVPHK